MPIYEYRCEDCQKKFELLVFQDKGEVKCPDCGGFKVTKLLSCFTTLSEKSWVGDSAYGTESCPACKLEG